MSKHTPGNWTWTRKGCTIESDGRPGKRATLVKVAVGFIDEEELEANGRLIAAAPTMRSYIEARAALGDAEAAEILEAIDGNA